MTAYEMEFFQLARVLEVLKYAAFSDARYYINAPSVLMSSSFRPLLLVQISFFWKHLPIIEHFLSNQSGKNQDHTMAAISFGVFGSAFIA